MTCEEVAIVRKERMSISREEGNSRSRKKVRNVRDGAHERKRHAPHIRGRTRLDSAHEHLITGSVSSTDTDRVRAANGSSASSSVPSMGTEIEREIEGPWIRGAA